MNIGTIIKLKFGLATPEVDYVIQDDGNGAYIKEWNLDEPMPTQQDLDTWAIEFDLQYRQEQVRKTRASLYPTWQEQLDMQYHDSLNGTTLWQDTIQTIKIENPIPNE